MPDVTDRTMKTMIIESHGGPEMFRPTTLPIPALRPGHVLIRVAATSVNPVDCLLRSTALPFSPPLPAVLHGDVAGTVAAVAPDVADFRPGDEVYACAGGVAGSGGALADVMLADAALVAHKPKSLSLHEAAALPLVTITAWEALFQRVNLTAEQTLLIHGGAGGVGHIAIQLAKLTGVRVCTTVSSAEKAEIARALGADAVINYREEAAEDYTARLTGGQGFDVVFDTVGGANLQQSFAAAKLNGQVVTTVALGDVDLSLAHLKGLSLHVEFMLIPLIHGQGRQAQGRILREAAQLVDEGKLKPRLDPHDFTFRQAGEAHALQEAGRAQGKIILRHGF